MATKADPDSGSGDGCLDVLRQQFGPPHFGLLVKSLKMPFRLFALLHHIHDPPPWATSPILAHQRLNRFVTFILFRWLFCPFIELIKMEKINFYNIYLWRGILLDFMSSLKGYFYS